MKRQSTLSVGDLLEWLSLLAFMAAGYLYLSTSFAGSALASLIGGVGLLYFAQCYNAPLPHLKMRLPKLMRRLSRKSKENQ